MKSIQKIVITVLSTLALSGTGTLYADTTATVSSDGFLELTLEEVAPKASTAVVSKPTKKTAKKVSKKTKKKSISQHRADRKKRAAKRKLRKSRSRTYRVRRGDTLTKISRKTGVSFGRLVRLNRLYGSKKNHIEVGQRLRLR